MRTLRLSLAGSVILGLLASLSMVVVAQEEEPAPVTFVTGTVVEQFGHGNQAEDRQVEWPEADEPRYVRGYEVFSGGDDPALIEQVMEWSDPRLPTEHWYTLDYTIISRPPEGEEGAMAVATSHLLEGVGGSWRGTGRAVETFDDRFSFYVLTGEGEYEGLYALLRGTPGMDAHGPWDHSYEGYIFEGELLSFPAPPEPVTTEGFRTFPYPSEPPSGNDNPIRPHRADLNWPHPRPL